MKVEIIYEIIECLKKNRNLDFSGFRITMLHRRIKLRIISTNAKNEENYLQILKNNSHEVDELIDVLTINHSSFFRNSLLWEYLTGVVFPELIREKIATGNSLRIWSAGCAGGEEPFSIAIILNEVLRRDKLDFNPEKIKIFATDIDRKILEKAKKAIYNANKLEHTKLAYLNQYFQKQGDNYILNNDIVKQVQFSFYDLLSSASFAPPESIFGDFDLVFCRNVMIYFEPDYQRKVYQKLVKSIRKSGLLVLGEAEIPLPEFNERLLRYCDLCKVYLKSNNN